MACLTRTEDVRTARGDNHCSEQVLLKILMLACVGYFIACYQSDGSGMPGLTITSNPGSGKTERAVTADSPGSGQSRRMPLTCPVD